MLSLDECRHLFLMVQQNLSISEISRRTGRSYQSITKAVKRYEQISQMSSDKKILAKKLIELGMPIKDIIKYFGLHENSYYDSWVKDIHALPRQLPENIQVDTIPYIKGISK